MADFFADLFNTAQNIAGDVYDFASGIYSGASSAFNDLTSFIYGNATSALGSAQSSYNSLINSLLNYAGNITSSASSSMTSLGQSAYKKASDVLTIAGSIGNSVRDAVFTGSGILFDETIKLQQEILDIEGGLPGSPFEPVIGKIKIFLQSVDQGQNVISNTIASVFQSFTFLLREKFWKPVDRILYGIPQAFNPIGNALRVDFHSRAVELVGRDPQAHITAEGFVPDGSPHIEMGIFSPVLGIAIPFQAASAMTEPFANDLRRRVYRDYPSQLPSASDLVRFQLREVFDKDFRAEQLANYPSLIYFDNMLELGLNKYWAESYWAAHWELPSTNQGYEMFWRLRPDRYDEGLTFTREDLKSLMKRNDILPAYIDKLIEIAYQPFTRVDVRRMRKLGVLDKDRVFNAYLDLGYSPINARTLADFVESDVNDDDVTAIRSTLISAYEDDIIDRQTLDSLVKPSFFRKDVYDIYIGIIDKRKAIASQKVLDKQSAAAERVPSLTTIRKRFLTGLIDEDKARESLSKLKYSVDDVELYILEWKASSS
jgi:hypothetical protein